MELISKEEFLELDWYTINFFIKGEPIVNFDSRVLRKDYYDTLQFIVKPFVEENEKWIKCFYYTQYFNKEDNTPYHVKIRIGTKETLQTVQEKLDDFIHNLPKEKVELLDKKTYDLEKMKELTHDRDRFARIEEGKFDDDVYYWFVMHWQTGSQYFLEILKNGYDKFPDLPGLIHLQWNLMGSIVTQQDKEYEYAPETSASFDRRNQQGIISVHSKFNIGINPKANTKEVKE